MASQTVCPPLAERHEIITTDNINSLSLSTYDRSPGTQVTITCLSSTTHKLVGPNTISCLQNGQWNASIPVCELIKQTVTTTTTQTDLSATTETVQEMNTYLSLMPYLAALVILAVVCIMLVVLLCYSFHLLKKQKRKSPYSFFEGTRSSTPSSSLQTDLWVEMASPRHFRSHEFTQSRDNMVQDLRYTPVNPEWSGY